MKGLKLFGIALSIAAVSGSVRQWLDGQRHDEQGGVLPAVYADECAV